MPLVTLDDVSIAHGDKPLLDQVSWQLDTNQRVCLMGRNGTGKSTMLKLLTQQFLPDSGTVRWDEGITYGYLPQDPPEPTDELVRDVVAAGKGEAAQLLREFQALSMDANADLDRLTVLQTKIDDLNAWQLEQQVNQQLKRFGLDGDQQLKSLSGGWRRRAWLARALISEPSVLILDEPTNHLDIAAIEWLEEFLLSFQGSLIFITHDRHFANRVASHFAELDRGKLYPYKSNLEEFLAYREKCLEDEAKANAEFDKKLAQEETWIRQGIKARRTRNEGRVRALKSLRNERSERRDKMGKASFDIGQADKSGKLVFEFKDLTLHTPEKPLVNGFTGQVMRGDRIGLVGINGCGKTTLLKALLGDRELNGGKLRVGTKLEVAYFDQTRAQIDSNKSVIDNLEHGSDFIGDGRRHILSYLQDFLFTPERARSPAGVLSGGERNRLLLAKMFLQPANLLILDEPTNDLDVETLELLEEQLSNFAGTVMLVSHDRAFLDALATQCWVFEGDGVLREYAGGFADAKRQGAKLPNEDVVQDKPEAKVEKAPPPSKSKPKAKLSYKIQRELDNLPGEIAELEAKIEAEQEYLGSTAFLALPHSEQMPKFDAHSALEAELEGKIERWMELEALQEE